ncbi:hypothetical protein [Undibacterium sp.]|uniref:hypothetical protein n=1 Tax=Undibacterium sp. TaxID=1914977 RepID=UPI00374C986E
MNPSIWAVARRRLLACCSLLALSAIAQPALAAEPAKQPDPLDPRAAVPALQYRSTLQSFRPFADQEVGDWKAQNETTGKIGGWRAYARQAREPDPAEAKAVKPTAVGQEAVAPAKTFGHQHTEHGQ